MSHSKKRIGRESETDCGGAVLEGRDIQTVVFPDADVKIFLTATSHARAQRRLSEWQQKSSHETAPFTVEEAERDIQERDLRDSTRKTSPLRAAPDAVHLETDDLTPAEVIDKLVQIVREKMNSKMSST